MKIRLDWISIAIIIVMGFALMIGVQYYLNIESNKCTADPFQYAMDYYEDLYGVRGHGTYYITPGHIIHFNSTSSYLERVAEQKQITLTPFNSTQANKYIV